VLEEVKRSSGLSVGALAERLGLSYMGVKAQCLALEKSGHLTSRNTHGGTGRPHLVYRLTQRGQEVFSTGNNRLAIGLLREAQVLYGATAAGKLLFLEFQRRLVGYAEQLAGVEDPGARLAALAGIREEEGCMARVEGGKLIEAHCPLREVFEVFPQAAEMEETLVSKALGWHVRRRVESVGDHYQTRFEAAPSDAGGPRQE